MTDEIENTPVECGQYAVAVTMTKDIPSGMNIATRLNVYRARSIDEAVGMAVQDAQKVNPKHQVFSITKMPVPDSLPLTTLDELTKAHRD